MTKKITPRSDRQVIENIVRAWESLRGGMSYDSVAVETWLNGRMVRAINAARKHLKEQRSK